MVELVGGGSVINGAYPVLFMYYLVSRQIVGWSNISKLTAVAAARWRSIGSL